MKVKLNISYKLVRETINDEIIKSDSLFIGAYNFFK